MVSPAADRLAFFFKQQNEITSIIPTSTQIKSDWFCQFQSAAARECKCRCRQYHWFSLQKIPHSHRLYSKRCAGEESPLFFQKKPNRSFRAIKHNINTKSIGKMVFPHLFPTWMRVGFVPVLCPAYLLLATGCLRLLSSSGLHCSRTPQASPASPLSSWTTTNGFGKLQKTTAFLVQYQTVLSMQKLPSLSTETTCLQFASVDGPVNSRTNNLHNWSPAWSLLFIYCIVCAQTHPHLLRFTYFCSTQNQKLTAVSL